MSKKDIYLAIKEIVSENCEIEHFDFWNDNLRGGEIDSFVTPAIFVEFTNMPISKYYQKTAETATAQMSRETVEFTLHVVTGKVDSDTRENDYIENIELAEEIEVILRNKTGEKFQNLRKISDGYDSNSSVLLDWQMTFTCQHYNDGVNELAKKTNTTMLVTLST